jgi:hypothetical protein
MADQITVTITSDAMSTRDGFARLLENVARLLLNPAFHSTYGENIVDQAGNKIGEWQITPVEQPTEDEIQDFNAFIQMHLPEYIGSPLEDRIMEMLDEVRGEGNS